MGRLLTDEVHIIQAKHMLVETTPLTFYSVGGARTLPLYCIVSFPAHRFRFQHGRGKSPQQMEGGSWAGNETIYCRPHVHHLIQYMRPHTCTSCRTSCCSVWKGCELSSQTRFNTVCPIVLCLTAELVCHHHCHHVYSVLRVCIGI